MFIFKFIGFFFFAILTLFGFFFLFSALLILRSMFLGGFKKKFFGSNSQSAAHAGRDYSRNQKTHTIEAEYRILSDKDK